MYFVYVNDILYITHKNKIQNKSMIKKNFLKVQIRTFHYTSSLKSDEESSSQIEDRERLERVRERFNRASDEASNCRDRISEFRRQHPGEEVPYTLRNSLWAANEELDDATLDLDYESVYGDYGDYTLSDQESERESNSNENSNNRNNNNESGNTNNNDESEPESELSDIEPESELSESDQESEVNNQNINTSTNEEQRGAKRSLSSDSTTNPEGPNGPKKPKGPEDPNDSGGGISAGPSNPEIGGGTTGFISINDNWNEIYLAFFNCGIMFIFLGLFIRIIFFFNSFEGKFFLLYMYIYSSSIMYRLTKFYKYL